MKKFIVLLTLSVMLLLASQALAGLTITNTESSSAYLMTSSSESPPDLMVPFMAIAENVPMMPPFKRSINDGRGTYQDNNLAKQTEMYVTAMSARSSPAWSLLSTSNYIYFDADGMAWAPEVACLIIKPNLPISRSTLVNIDYIYSDPGPSQMTPAVHSGFRKAVLDTGDRRGAEGNLMAVADHSKFKI
ncbi:MAG: hypothetical protein WC270_06405 [Patescibacteria group bacterium]